MMRYLTYQRFSFLDFLCIIAATKYVTDGNYTSATLMFFGGLLLSICLKAIENESA